VQATKTPFWMATPVSFCARVSYELLLVLLLLHWQLKTVRPRHWTSSSCCRVWWWTHDRH
jgi:hypothetical protein